MVIAENASHLRFISVGKGSSYIEALVMSRCKTISDSGSCALQDSGKQQLSFQAVDGCLVILLETDSSCFMAFPFQQMSWLTCISLSIYNHQQLDTTNIERKLGHWISLFPRCYKAYKLAHNTILSGHCPWFKIMHTNKVGVAQSVGWQVIQISRHPSQLAAILWVYAGISSCVCNFWIS